MKILKYILLSLSGILLITCAGPKTEVGPPRQSIKWHGLHLLSHQNDEDLAMLCEYVPQLAEMGINVLILEVDYHFQFESHPELRQGDRQITPAGAKALAECCKKSGIRLIPEFQCLGHQSWAETTFPLLTVYPELDLTPGAFPGNDSIYCREWDPTNPRVYEIILPMLDEIIDAFEADAMHVGMDEVFLLGREESPTTNGMDPAKLFAQAVNDIYAHLVTKRGIEMLLWGDRLIDGNKYPQYGEWEAAVNGTAGAIEMIPKDIIICDWHYEQMETYPSVPMFIEKGFRVWPSSWRDVDAAKQLIDYSYRYDSPKMLGHLFTTWSGKIDERIEFPSMVEGLELLFELEEKLVRK